MLSSWFSWLRDGCGAIWRHHDSLLRSGMLLVLMVQLLADFNPSFADQTSGGLPFFRDDGELTLPAQSQAEMEESMPELQLFQPNQPSPPADLLNPPPLG